MKVLLSIIDAIKTIGHSDDLMSQPNVGELANHEEIGNFIELVNFVV